MLGIQHKICYVYSRESTKKYKNKPIIYIKKRPSPFKLGLICYINNWILKSSNYLSIDLRP